MCFYKHDINLFLNKYVIGHKFLILNKMNVNEDRDHEAPRGTYHAHGSNYYCSYDNFNYRPTFILIIA